MELAIIQKTVCEYFNIPVSNIQSKKRDHPTHLRPRQWCHYFASKLTGYSSTVIGSNIGNVDHATVLNSKKTIQNLIDTSNDYKNKFKQLDTRIDTALLVTKTNSILYLIPEYSHKLIDLTVIKWLKDNGNTSWIVYIYNNFNYVNSMTLKDVKI